MPESIGIGDRVEVYFDSSKWRIDGWYTGTVVRIDPYSDHRCFYWVALDTLAHEELGVKEISVFNPKNIKKLA